MSRIGELALQCGVDIPFREGSCTIHAPTLREISFVGEDCFLIGVKTLNFSKDLLEDKDKNNTKDSSNFDILLTILKDNSNVQSKKIRACVMLVLFLMFPDARVEIEDSKITFSKDDNIGFIDNSNFEIFKENIFELFCLNQLAVESEEYNPGNELARKIAEKLKKGRDKASAIKNQDMAEDNSQKIAIYSKYISILSVGLKKDKKELSEYTVYQIVDEFKRFVAKQGFDIAIEARMAGAQDVGEIDNWMN